MKKKNLIGRIDKADLPEFNLYNIAVKIDSGAFTSSIHCHHIVESMQGEIPVVSFELLDPSHPQYSNQVYTTRHYKKTMVKNSFGQSELRYVIKTTIVLFAKKYRISLTLSSRDKMKYPLLLGRKILNRSFIIDTTKTNLSYKAKQKKKP